ncbi:MAG TPA: 30S ribosomal protein S10 [Candidatus Lokiarchaeia archaeon]|nr:30S ribosomal protein S10 [Candidatus Lokiarchaeia archaeon]
MVQKARIRLSSTDVHEIENVTKEIKEVAARTGVKMYGPIPLPTKRLRVTTMKSPCGEGTNTWEKWEMRVHKRLVDLLADDRSMALVMKIQIPDSVIVEIELL